jgi:hypothetical protein
MVRLYRITITSTKVIVSDCGSAALVVDNSYLGRFVYRPNIADKRSGHVAVPARFTETILDGLFLESSEGTILVLVRNY